MDVVIGIAAKSLDAAYQLAKALNGPCGWAWQQSISLQPTSTSASSVPGAAARLLLSHDSSTAYILVATHATAEELLLAAAAVSKEQLPPASTPESETAATPTNASASGVTVTVAAAAVLQPLQRLQQQHEVAVNVLLLQLFLACDSVLGLLPTGQGLGLAGFGAAKEFYGASGCGDGGGCSGPLTGAVAWVSRLRQLQGAKRALHNSLRGAGRAPSRSTAAAASRGRSSITAPTLSRANGDASASGSTLSAAASEGLVQLRSWCDRPRPPTLFFLSLSDPVDVKTGWWSSFTSSGGPCSTNAQRSTAAQRSVSATAATDPRDANSLFRDLLKRCRPVPLSGAPESVQLCKIDPVALVLEPGPLVLEPAIVHATVLEALLQPVDSDATKASYGNTSYGTDSEAGWTGPRKGEGLHVLTQRLAMALAAAEEDESPSTVVGSSNPRPPGKPDAGAASNSSVRGGDGHRGGGAGNGGEEGIVASRQFCIAWEAAARELYDATMTAWREAAAQPLDWAPPGMEGGARQVPGHLASTAHSRTRLSATTSTSTPVAATGSSAVRGSCAKAVLEPAAAWLAGGGLAARLAAELSREAADAALRQYMGTAPQRYPERVHAVAVAAAVAALRAAAPPGPAASWAAVWLQTACEKEWRRVTGRRQCSVLSATGRPCTRPVHDLSEPHCSETTVWVTATTTGCNLVTWPDPFDLQAVNTAAALDDGPRVAALLGTLSTSASGGAPSTSASAGGGRVKGGKRGGGGSAAATTAIAATKAAGGALSISQSQQQPPVHTRHPLVAIAQTTDGSTRQCSLGPWVTVTRLGPASSYNERRGLTNQPGLNGSCLYPLVLHLETGSGVSGHRSGSAGRCPAGLRTPGGAGKQHMPRDSSTGCDTPDASSAAAGGSDNETGILLDEQSFPSLAEATAATLAGRHQAGTGAPGGPMGHKRASKQQTCGKGGAHAAATVSKERERLARVWPYPHGSGATSSKGGAGVGRSGGSNAQEPLPPAGASRGRRGRSTAGPAGDMGSGTDSAVFPPLSGTKDVKKVYVGYEYQTLDGRRFLATPQQLAVATAGSSPLSGATTSKPPSTNANLSASAIPPQPGRKGNSRPATGLTVATATATDSNTNDTAVGGIGTAVGGGRSSAASFLLQHDAPLYLQPPPGLQPDPTAPGAHDGAATWDPTPRRPCGLAQLQRMFIVTPPSTCGEPLLAARPTVQFCAQHPPQLPRDAASAVGLLLQGRQPLGSSAMAADDGNDLIKAGAEKADNEGVMDTSRANEEEKGLAAQLVSGSSPAATVVQMSLAKTVPLPPDSFLVISLPLLYGLPADWLGWTGFSEEGNTRIDILGEMDSNTARSVGKEWQQVERIVTEDTQDCTESGVSQRGDNGSLLLPLVQFDDRLPFEACLLAGSSIFPLLAAQTSTSFP